MTGFYQRSVSKAANWSPGADDRTAVACRPVGRASAYPKPQHSAQLARTIETEIIPRLMLVHGAAATPPASRTTFTPQQVAEFANLTLRRDAGTGAALQYVETWRAEGVAVDTLLLGLLAPAARFLGDLWSEDLCDFTEVTVGLCRLHHAVHVLCPGFPGEPGAQGRRALLLPVPGEQHIFGLCVVAAFLRQAHWDVWVEPAMTGAELCRAVRNEWFDMVGLSLSCDARLEQLTADVVRLRQTSCNDSLLVLVGGRVFAARPELAAQVGADGTAVDARQAVVQAEAGLPVRGRAV